MLRAAPLRSHRGEIPQKLSLIAEVQGSRRFRELDIDERDHPRPDVASEVLFAIRMHLDFC